MGVFRGVYGFNLPKWTAAK